MIKPALRKNDWKIGLTRLHDLGAPVPDHTCVGGTFTHSDASNMNVLEIGGWWVEHRDMQSAEFVTWLRPGFGIEETALSEKERYWANVVAVRELMDHITIGRTGHMINAKEGNDRLRALARRLNTKNDFNA